MTEKRLPPAVADRLAYLLEIGFSELSLKDDGSPESQWADGRTEAGERGASASSGNKRLREVEQEASECELCELSSGRNRVVFGSGNPHANLMLIGEGPGAEEDRQGLPFVGPAGELLTRILRAIDLDRDQVYIANIVKCRPPGNRDPRPEEAAACRRYLDLQIELVQPKIIVALGRVAAQDLLDTDLALGRLRGQWHRVMGVPTRVTYHPAALLRNSNWKRPTWEDMQEVRDRLLRESAD
jgi:DNA polymerase